MVRSGKLVVLLVCRKLMKAKGPAGAKADEDKKKAVTLFGPKPPTPKFLRAFGNVGKGGWLEKLKVRNAPSHTHKYYLLKMTA